MGILFAHGRVHRIKTLAYLADQEEHARRIAAAAELRPGAMPGTSIRWSMLGGEALDYVGAFQQVKAATGARERGGAAIGLHLLLGVSTEWIEEFGDLHDPQNHRNHDLAQCAKRFAEEKFGNVTAVRLDLDERGGAVVDVYCVPVSERLARLRKDGSRGASVTEISVKKALDDLVPGSKGKGSFSALQTAWAAYAKANLDHRFVRGRPKAETGREHLPAPEFRQMAEELKAKQAQLDGRQATVVNTLIYIDRRHQEQDERERDLQEKAEALRIQQRELQGKLQTVNDRERQQDERDRSLEIRQARLETATANLERKMVQVQTVDLFQQGLLVELTEARELADRREAALNERTNKLGEQERNLDRAARDLDDQRQKGQNALERANARDEQQRVRDCDLDERENGLEAQKMQATTVALVQQALLVEVAQAREETAEVEAGLKRKEELLTKRESQLHERQLGLEAQTGELYQHLAEVGEAARKQRSRQEELDQRAAKQREQEAALQAQITMAQQANAHLRALEFQVDEERKVIEAEKKEIAVSQKSLRISLHNANTRESELRARHEELSTAAKQYEARKTDLDRLFSAAIAVSEELKTALETIAPVRARLGADEKEGVGAATATLARAKEIIKQIKKRNNKDGYDWP